MCGHQVFLIEDFPRRYGFGMTLWEQVKGVWKTLKKQPHVGELLC